MEKLCDLHTHSHYSDGTLSPAELLDEAQRAGLSAIVLCDHNTVAGLQEFTEAACGRAVEAVPGIEFTTEYKGKELHIIGMFISPAYYNQITDMVTDLLARKEKSERELVEALCRDGIDLCYDDIKAKTKGGYVNRAHIAVALMEKGLVSEFREAFRRYLNPDRGYYVPPKRFDVFEIIRYIKQIGGVAVLAHPFLNLSEEELRDFLPSAKASGLDAMETLYAKYSETTTKLACDMAAEYGILPSGGSDYHGTNKPDTQMGTGQGDLRVPLSFLDRLRLRAE